MTDDASSGEAGGTSTGVTPTAPVMTPTKPLHVDEGADHNDEQALGTSGSDGIPETDQAEMTKATNPYDALLASEKAPDPTNHFRTWLKENGFELKSYLDLRIAEFISSKEIYEMWVGKLRKYAESYDKSAAGEKAPRLARSFVDYVQTVDDRLERIESKIGINTKSTKEPDDVPGKEHSVQTKFYNASTQPQAKGMSMEDDDTGWNEQGTFISEVDRKHCLRVLFNWVQEPTTETDSQRNDEHPDPERIEISDIRIHSDPITTFLAKQVDYDVQKDSVVHLKRPFRMLIRKVDSIKKQLASLEREYSHAEVDKPRSGSLDAVIDDLHQNSDPSVPPKTSNEDPDGASRKPSYERKEALDDFRELVAFLDQYLGKEISLFKGYSTAQIHEIAFESLWMLFDAGELIYCPTQKRDGTLPKIYNGENRTNSASSLEVHTPQAYRVLGTVGGITATKERKRPGLSHFEPIVHDRIPDVKDESGDVAVLSKRDRYTPLYIDCYFVYFDGTRFSPGQTYFEFKPFEGVVKVQSLLAYPMRYRATETGPVLDLHERGRRFLDLTVVDHRHYDGVTLGRDKEDINSPVIIDYKMGLEYNEQWELDFPWKFMASWKDEPRQILEIPTRSCSHTDCHKSACLEDAYPAHQKDGCEKKMRSLTSQFDEIEIPTSRSGPGLEKLEAQMAEMDLLNLLPGHGLAYVLRGRKWGQSPAPPLLKCGSSADQLPAVQVDIMKLGEIRQEEGWDDLVLPQRHKNLVQAMVQTHAAGSRSATGQSQTNFEVDLVRGKGKGCILLLHGEPGVGKTSTAECVALYTKRPLYPITCGDIGTDPKEVEQNLEKHFTLAHKWGCVLLLDEADVFLAKRDVSIRRQHCRLLPVSGKGQYVKVISNGAQKFDVARNGLVSVFLRILEYYSGILFLTTNRVGTLDPAFRSRIHVTLYYRKLNRKRALMIWETNLRRLHRLNEDRVQQGLKAVEFDEKSIVKYAEKHLADLKWNGRQIRNAFQTAIALAEFEASDSSEKVPTMTKKHFVKLGKAAAEFDEYLESVHGMDEDKMAKRNEERATVSRKPGKRRPRRDSGDDSDSSDESDSDSSSDNSSSESSDSDSDDSRAKSKKKKSKSKSSKSKGKDKKKQKHKEKASSGKSSRGGHAKDDTTVDED